MSVLFENPVVLVLVISIILIAIFAAIVIATILSSSSAKRRKRSITAIRGDLSKTSAKEEKAARSKRKEALSKRLKEQEDEKKEKDKKKNNNTVKIMLQQAGINLSPLHFWGFALILGIVVGGVLSLAGFSPIKSVIAALISFLFVPRMILNHLRKRRQKEFLENFSDALDSVVRLLKAGTPISEAISMLSKEYSGAIGEEMTTIYDRQKIGVPLHEAAQEAVSRMPLTEMSMFATALTIQAQTGSSLSTILTSLSGTIRDRFKLKRKVKALSQEAMSSAGIIAALPFLVMGGLYFSNPDYLMLLFTTVVGKMLFWGAMGWMALGAFVMKQMVNFKV